MSTTINPATSVENWPPTGIIVFLGGRKVNHGEITNITSNISAVTVMQLTQTVMNIGAYSSNNRLFATGKRSLTGGIGCR